MRHISLLLVPLLLAGCATTPAAETASHHPQPAPGMERVLGHPAEVALGLLGDPTLDRREGMARQLQFAGACVLDIFYVQKMGEAPLAVHTEARLPNGRDVPAAECMQSLLKARALVKPQS